jgi:hypothetical protein
MNGATQSLRWSIAGAVLLVLLGISAAWYGTRLHADATLLHAQAQARAIDAQQKLGRAHAERRDIDAYLPRYNNLRTLGAIDNENRLDWVERIAAIRTELHSTRLSFNVEPRQAYAMLPPPGAGLRFEASPMRLEFSEVRACSLAREAGGGEGATSPGLSGICQFDWISLVGAAPPSPEPGASR